jgi:type II secretory pathway pseudopilin PulG
MKYTNTQSGFTLVETIVATTVFVSVVTMGITAVLNVNTNYAKNRAQRSIIDNMTFVVEDLTRNIRLGSSYQCIPGIDPYPYTSGDEGWRDCGTGNPPISGDGLSASNAALAFESFDRVTGDAGDQIVYRFLENQSTGIGAIQKSTDGGETFLVLTPPEIDIDTARSGFWVFGSDPSDGYQPKVILQIAGSITERDQVSPLFIQTTISQRPLDAQ